MEQREMWDSLAEAYDESSIGRLDPSKAVREIKKLAQVGPLLELGIGTGRLAIPLAGEGIEVDGVDISERMIAILEKKVGNLPIRIISGDMAECYGEGKYEVVIAAYGVLPLLQTQKRQLTCMRNAAKSLAAGGHMVIEFMHPQAFAGKINGQKIAIQGMGDSHLDLSATIVDISQQTLTFQNFSLGTSETKFSHGWLRWIWPSELDLMAKMAGLELVSRTQDWDGTPVTSESLHVISVYKKV